ncbi:tyrosine-protein phosphatase [Nocardioides sp. AX2bis]|uniref:tyrosine-protein phosphatase n=1 Tax=Nocardioides sp. AX2bis TaxID=2653157 RepID=UPI0012F2A767|nr:tyrosine-protein phosphatase [Nocardioides sp. AX2bis]VXA92049.1 Tyrosine-protein phosphatase [Nocardioides sp. AX2bis]
MTTPRWDGARNLRDLGGLPLAGGGRTRGGQVFRSAAPTTMTDRGWREAASAGLARVVDLRNAEEREGGRHPGGAVGVEVVHAPLEDPHDAAYLEEVGPWLDHPHGWEATVRRFPDLVAAAVVAVVEAPGPVLLHCQGGRDRAGMLSALLLAAVGVETDAVVGDYAGGFRGAATHPGHGLAWDGATGSWVTRTDPVPTAAELEHRVADRLPAARAYLLGTDVPAVLLAAGVPASALVSLRTRLADRGR